MVSMSLALISSYSAAAAAAYPVVNTQKNLTSMAEINEYIFQFWAKYC